MLAACDEPPASIDFADTWALAPTPRVSIGIVDGDERYTFTRIVGARLMPDGGVLVADAIPSLTIYDSAGAFVRRFGRKGAGPGEFELLFHTPFPYRGDSIGVWDFGLSRVSVFDAGGTFGRLAPIFVPRRFWPAGTIPEQSCCHLPHALADGSFVLEYPGLIPTQPGPARHSMVTLTKVASDGSAGDTIGTFESELYRYDATAPNNVRAMRLNSRFVHAVVGDTIFAGNGEGPWLLRIVAGSPPDTIHIPQALVPVTPAVRDAYAAAWRAEYARRPEIFEGPPEELFEGEYATHLPAYTSLLHDGAGGLWLGQWALPFDRAPRWFHVYSTRGRPIARIALPWSARIGDIRGDRVALIESDSLGVEYVRAYDIIRNRPN